MPSLAVIIYTVIYKKIIYNLRDLLFFRACRLKKKQQHEANKVKLHGLENEQGLCIYLCIYRYTYNRRTHLIGFHISSSLFILNEIFTPMFTLPENLTYILNDMKNEIVSWTRLPRRPGNTLNEKMKDMEKKALCKCEQLL